MKNLGRSVAWGQFSDTAAWHQPFSSTDLEEVVCKGELMCKPVHSLQPRALLGPGPPPQENRHLDLTDHPPLSPFWFPPPRSGCQPLQWPPSGRLEVAGEPRAADPGTGRASHARWASPAGSLLPWAVFLRPQKAAPRKELLTGGREPPRLSAKHSPPSAQPQFQHFRNLFPHPSLFFFL